MEELTIQEWDPQPKQKIFLKISSFEAMFGGAKGPGKTDALLADATRYIPNPKYKGIIFRRTYPKMSEIISRSHQLFHKCAKWNSSSHTWKFVNGASLKFWHMESEDDKYNIQGHEYHFMGFDQLEEFTETQYRFAILQCRSTVPGLKPYVRSTANPIGIGHAWVKSRFIDKCPPDGLKKYFKLVKTEKGEIEIETTKEDPMALSRSFVQANVYDNPILLKNDPQYLKVLQTLPEALRKALMDGDWNALVGQYFTEWQPQTHVIPYAQYLERVNNGQNVSRFIAMDYGFKAPASVGWYAVFPEGQIIRYREHYIEGKTYPALAQEILDLCYDNRGRKEKIDYMTADPAIWGDKDHHAEPKDGKAKGESGFDKMAQVIGEEFPIIMADNRRIVGWTRMREFLSIYNDQHGNPTANLLITDNCKNFVRCIPGAVYDKTKKEDLDTTGEDHVLDECRYGLMSRHNVPKPDEKPKPAGVSFWDKVRNDLSASKLGEGEDHSEPNGFEVLEEGSSVIEG